MDEKISLNSTKTRSLTTKVSKKTYKAFEQEADSRGIAIFTLLNRICVLVAKDNLFEAILGKHGDENEGKEKI